MSSRMTTSSPSDQIVELVARAMHARVQKPPNFVHGVDFNSWDGMAPSDRATFLGAAQAALSALRQASFAIVPVEPTEAMLDAGTQALWPPQTMLPGEASVTAYRAMLQAHDQQDHNPSGGRAEAAPDGATEGAPDQTPLNR